MRFGSIWFQQGNFIAIATVIWAILFAVFIHSAAIHHNSYDTGMTLHI